MARLSPALIGVLSLGCIQLGAYQPRAIHDTTTGGAAMRFECWDTDRDCQSDAVHRCGGGYLRGIKIVDRRELVDANGRKLIVMDVKCAQ